MINLSPGSAGRIENRDGAGSAADVRGASAASVSHSLAEAAHAADGQAATRAALHPRHVQPLIRNTAAVGDCVVGTGSATRGRAGYLVYAMRVSEVITFDDYWRFPRFVRG
jgi:hypothetical protein